MTTKIMTLGQNRPIPISLDEEYLTALSQICKARNQEPEDFCRAWIEFAIRHNCSKYGVHEPKRRDKQ